MRRSAQQKIVARVREIASQAPFVQQETPSGAKMSVRMTAAGETGWITDRTGYRYSATRVDGSAWPPIPAELLEIWNAVSGTTRSPDSCLVNYYDESARMGLHQDKDEADLTWPVVSVSLGDDALFRIGNSTRCGKTESLWLRSGDVVVLAGPSRLLFHGIDRIRPASSTLLPNGGRINLTLRVAL